MRLETSKIACGTNLRDTRPINNLKVTVGLPARGKTYIAHKASRYLNWLGIKTRVFNVGQYRRKISGAQLPHDFFDSHNRLAEEERRRAAEEALGDLIVWLGETDEQVGIYDATNSTYDRRRMVKEACESKGISVLTVSKESTYIQCRCSLSSLSVRMPI